MFGNRIKSIRLMFALGTLAAVSLSCNVLSPTAQIASPALQVSPGKSTDSAKLIVGDISELKDKSECDNLEDTLVYAETENYTVNICSKTKGGKDPAFLRIVKKDGSLKITGIAKLSWREDAFVGISEKYGYRLQMPSSSGFDLLIASGRERAPVLLKENIQLYYAINQFRQTKKVDELMSRIDSNLPNESKRLEFIHHIFDNRLKFGACRSRDDRRKEEEYSDSRLWKIDDKKYFLELGCHIGAYSITLNLFLITESHSGYHFKLLNIPKIARYKNGKPIVRENGYVTLIDIPIPSTTAREHFFNLKEKTLSIYMGKGSCGTLSKYRIGDRKLDLVEHREGGLKECDDFRYAADPSLYPNIPLEPAK